MPDYYNIESALKKGMAWNVVIGGRGIGKTYSTLQKAVDEGKKIILMRYTKKEVSYCSSKKGNPFKKLNTKRGWHIGVAVSGEGIGIISDEETHEMVGYVISLADISDVKSIDFSEIDWIIFDEIVRKKNSRKLIQTPGTDFLDFVETVARNRELEGEEPVKVIMLSNSTNYESEILLELNITREFEVMLSKGHRRRTIRERDLFIEMPSCSVSEEKRNTSLYRFARGTNFERMALDNEFAYDDFYNVRAQKVIEYLPLVSYGSLVIYQHKSDSRYYARIGTESCPHFDENTHVLFKRNFGITLEEAEICGNLIFENLHAKLLYHKAIE